MRYVKYCLKIYKLVEKNSIRILMEIMYMKYVLLFPGIEERKLRYTSSMLSSPVGGVLDGELFRPTSQILEGGKSSLIDNSTLIN